MTERGTANPGIRLDMQQLQLEAQHRWLRPAEICEILMNYQMFRISPEPPNRPPSGSLFLFDRKVLRYFRKDNHNWRKKKCGKIVNEAHEKLKVGSIDVLHCYYAHGEDNDYFQRRCYWLLEKEYMHIVFVHYLEVKGSKSCIRETESRMAHSPMSTSLSNSQSNNYSESFHGNSGSPSPTSSLTSAYEEVESDGNQQAMSKFPPLSNKTGNAFENDNTASTRTTYPISSEYYPVANGQEFKSNGITQSGTLDFSTWEEVYEQCTRSLEPGVGYPLLPSMVSSNLGVEDTDQFSQLSDGSFMINSALGASVDGNNWQNMSAMHTNDHSDLSNTEYQGEPSREENGKYHPNKQYLLGSLRTENGLQKADSFNKWMSKELGEVGELQLKSSASIAWCNIGSDDSDYETTINHELQLDNYSLSPSISQDQLFSITDVVPNMGYTDSATEVIVLGTFLKSRQDVNLSCMFGEVEVPAVILKDGTGLSCRAPLHRLGRVPFYITCSNRLACSEVREFEYRLNPDSVLLHERLDRLLSLWSAGNKDSNSDNLCDKLDMVSTITLLLEYVPIPKVLEVSTKDGSDPGKLLKEKIYNWLLEKINEDGKGPNILDEEGQGLIHLAAALGYDWVIEPALAAGVNVNFRDVNGWTALHWAAFHGREKTVALLVLLGASSGALTDPSPEFPTGRTPADLASANGFKGISGFLSESLLTAHLAALNMTDQEVDRPEGSSLSDAIQTISARTATPGFEFDSGATDALSMKDSLAAVLNATQAHGRIHQVFRMQSFQRKKNNQSAEDNLSGEINARIVPRLPSRFQRSGQQENYQAYSAALQIQKKFRGWSKRKQFLIFRQRVVKIQAHVRGHQVRKRYKTVIWSVGILEKVILRWRRKGHGLRGFRSGAPQQQISCEQDSPSIPARDASKDNGLKDDDYDYLKEGRKQAEQRLQKALVRVKSMVQYPEARAQYRRLLTAVEDMQKSQLGKNRNFDSSEGSSFDGEDDMLDVERLLDDANFMDMTLDGI